MHKTMTDLRNALAQLPRDGRNPSYNGTCVYVAVTPNPEAQPNCIAGAVFKIWGATDDDLRRHEYQNADEVAAHLGYVQTWTDEVALRLADLQNVADTLITWGAAIDAADV